MKKLMALVFYHANTSMPDARHPQPMDETVEGARSPYRLVKLFNDGSTEPVDQAKIDLAIQWVQERGWTKAWGYWLNSNPALVWARLPADFERAWGQTELRCACRYAKRGARNRYKVGAYINSLIQVGGDGVIAPTRSRRQIWEMRARFPFYWDDLLYVPIEVLVAQECENEADKQAIAKFYPGSVDRIVTKQRRENGRVLPAERIDNVNRLFKR